MDSIPGVRPATVTGLNLARAKRDAKQRAFLGADIKAGAVVPEGLTEAQTAQLVGASLPYLRAAEKVAAVPELRARVERGEISLIAAAKSLRPQQCKPAQLDLFEMFAGASVAERAECMRAFVDEAFEVFDNLMAPDVSPAMPDSFVPSHHSL
jgi:hypothetical protein